VSADEDENASDDWLTGQGLAMGIAVGSAVGVATGDIGGLLPVGPGLGIALGAAFSQGL
jgi:hypothetical protein